VAGYKAPMKGKEFKKYWDKLSPIITNKLGFDESCLKNLEILCNLYVDYDRMTESINDNDMVIVNEGRYGIQCRPFPLINERQKILGEIRHFSKLLGMKIDHESKPDEELQDEWE